MLLRSILMPLTMYAQLGPAPPPHLQMAGMRELAHSVLPRSVVEINDRDLTYLGENHVLVSFSTPFGSVSHTDLSTTLKQTREGRVIQFTVWGEGLGCKGA